MSWSSRFPEPIVLPDGASLRTLRDAVAHLGKTVPKSDQDMPAVTIAAELLTMAAEHGAPIEFARIATLQAINRHGVREFTDRKAAQWGRRKLKREEE